MSTKLSLRTQMKISPQLVIASNLLQAPTRELEQILNKELANNPALEFANKSGPITATSQFSGLGYPSRARTINLSIAKPQHFSSFEEIVENIAQRPSPLEKLAEQVSMAFEKVDREIAIYLLHCLDHRGFLGIPPEQLAGELGVSSERITQVIQRLHELEPPGIGARDLRECFLLQCTHLEDNGIDCQKVRRILTLAWEEFLAQQWDRVAKKIQEPKRVVEEACNFMRLNFDPHPLSILETSIETSEVLHYADLIVIRNSHVNPPDYVLQIPGVEEFELKMSTSFQTVLGTEARDEIQLSLKEKTWIRNHADRAMLIIGALRQRWETLRKVGEFLIQYQREFLEKGPPYLKPLTRAVMAQELNVHESTVSRAVRDKTIQLPNGRLIPLCDLFDSSLAAKEAIRLLFRESSKRLCDREIAQGLQSRGIHLSRRTVAKYRHEMNRGAMTNYLK